MLNINYLYENLEPHPLLWNFCIFTGLYHGIISRCNQYKKNKTEIIAKTLEDIKLDQLLHNLKKAWARQYFEDPEIQKLLILTYPVEVEQKFLQKENISIDTWAIMTTFEKLHEISYTQEVTKKVNINTIAWFQELRKRTYEQDEIETYIQRFFAFVQKILLAQKYEKENAALQDFIQHKLKIKKSAQGSITKRYPDSITVYLANNYITTLFHELTHVVNKFFRNIYNEAEQKIPDFKRTKHLEWFANFIGFNAIDTIIEEKEINYEPIFISPYSYTYRQVYKNWSNNIEHNKTIIRESLSVFSNEYKEKIDYLHQRFYRFFPYEQNKFLYPKELLYQIGYDNILQSFKKAENKDSLLAKYLLNKFD